MPLFTISTYPALLVQIEGRTFKFAGGKLEVSDEDAELVQRYADRYTRYRISASDGPDRKRRTVKEPAKEAKEPTERQALQAALRDIDESTAGTNEELAQRLTDAVGD